MYRIKLGIEKSIVGFFFITPFFFFYMGKNRYSFGYFIGILSEADTEFLPYLSFAIIALSYLMGTIIDTITYSAEIYLGPPIKKMLLKKRSEKRDAFIESMGDKINYSAFTKFLQVASTELYSEYSLLRWQNILYRVLAAAVFINIPFLLYWLIKIHTSIRAIWLVAITGTFLGFVFIFSYIENRRQYKEFRDAAFELFRNIEKVTLISAGKMPKSIEAPGPGPGDAGPST